MDEMEENGSDIENGTHSLTNRKKEKKCFRDFLLIRYLLIAISVSIVVISTILGVSISLVAGNMALTRLAEQVETDRLAHSMIRLETRFNFTEEALRYINRSLLYRNISFDNWSEIWFLRRELWNVVESDFGRVVGIALTNGNLLIAQNISSVKEEVCLTYSESGNTSAIKAILDNNGDLKEIVEVIPSSTSDPWFFSAPWYLRASKLKTQTWITFTENETLYFWNILPLFQNNTFMGILFMSCEQDFFFDFFPFTSNSLLFFLDDQGYLLASSNNAPVVQNGLRIHYSQAQEPIPTIVNCANSQTQEETIECPICGQEESIECSICGQEYFVTVTSFPSQNFNWTVILVDPRIFFTHTLEESNTAAIIISSIVSFIGICCAIVFTLCITRPIELVARTMENLTETEDLMNSIEKLRTHQDNFSSFYEVRHIQKAFYYLLNKLSQFLNEINRVKETAERANEAKTMFLSKMSHELRTPLHGINGLTSLLRSYDFPEDKLEIIDGIQSCNNMLLALISDILDISKVEIGAENLIANEFDIITSVEEVIDVMKYRSKELELACYIDPKIPTPLSGVSSKVIQVLNNLVTNAIKFTPKGYIFVSVKLEPHKEEKMVNVVFSCKDTGIGIKSCDQEKIFEPFFQVDNGSQRMYDGIGLGLSICASIMSALNGKIWVESEFEKGSTFFFQLPLQKVENSDSPKFDTNASSSLVLIVVPDNIHHNVLKLYLKDLNYSYHSVFCVGEALTMIENIITGELNTHSNKSLIIILDDQFKQSIKDLESKIPSTISFRWIFLAPNFSDLLSSKGHTNSLAEQPTYPNSISLFKPIRINKLVSALLAKPNKQQLRIVPTIPSEPKSVLPILCVDDNTMNVRILSKLLKRFNYETDIAQNGQIALEKVENSQYSLILMDLHMPIMDGWTATQEIRKKEKEKNKPPISIIAVTADALESVRSKCLEVGMTDVLTKPFKDEDLKNLIEKYLNIQ